MCPELEARTPGQQSKPQSARHAVRAPCVETDVGQWAHDKRSGSGTYTFACGDTYEGEWLDGKYHGHGKYSSAESDEYEGQWKEDKMSGHGKYRYRELVC